MKWRNILWVILIMCTSCNRVDIGDLREGDVVFIESKSQQSPYIKAGTMCKWTHCGVVVNTAKGLRILEASKTVMLTPIDKFIGRAKNGNYMAKRPRQQLTKPISYSKWLGQPYDLAFKFDNDKMYCSELVEFVYRKASGYSITEGRRHSVNLPAIEYDDLIFPSDFIESSKLRTVIVF
jgi:hypothetical protein